MVSIPFGVDAISMNVISLEIGVVGGSARATKRELQHAFSSEDSTV